MFRQPYIVTFRFTPYSGSIGNFVLSISARYIVLIFSCLLPALALSQRLPTVPAEVSFGGETIFLNASAQQRLQQEITSLYADRSVLRSTTEQMNYVESLVRPMLEERAMPADIRYACLPIDASNGAYWDLDTRKASRLNLRVDPSVDERLNVASSSEAVLGELAQWHEKYPNWNWIRILLNYATGQQPDAPANAVEPGGSRLPNDQFQLPPDGPALVWATLARKVVFEYEFQFSGPNTTPYLLYDYRQGRGKSLSTIARELSIEQARFMPFNEWLRVRAVPTDKVYPVLIRLTPAEFIAVKAIINSSVQLGQPPQAGASVRRDLGFPVLRKMPAPPSSDLISRDQIQFYEINEKKGIQAQICDNVITLAYYGQISVKAFMAINDMNDRDLVRPGEIYYLENKDRKAKIPFHVMQIGQTLHDVSSVYGIRMKSLLKYNQLGAANQRLQPGRILWLREKRPSNVPAEYQVLPPEPPVQQELASPQRNLTREIQDSVATNPSPFKERLPTADSVKKPVVRPDSVAKPIADSKPPVVKEPEKAAPAKAPVPAPAKPRSDNLVNRVRVETPKINGNLYYHIVQRGQTVYRVALINRVRVEDVMRWNNLSSYTIEIGQRLLIKK